MSLIEKARMYLTSFRDSEISFLKIYSDSDKEFSMPQEQTPYIFFVLDGELTLIAKILDDTLEDDFKTKQDRQVLSCLERMMDAVKDSLSANFICRQIRTEMLFHVLCGSCGKAFIQSITSLKSAGEIYEANSWIKENYRKNFKVEDLAEQWNMSVSGFHKKFKNAVGMGPLQCQKRLRLTEARRLMLDEGKNATEAAFDVGYESLSQFTREYRKMFGYPPSEDIPLLKKK